MTLSELQKTIKEANAQPSPEAKFMYVYGSPDLTDDWTVGIDLEYLGKRRHCYWCRVDGHILSSHILWNDEKTMIIGATDWRLKKETK